MEGPAQPATRTSVTVIAVNLFGGNANFIKGVIDGPIRS